ncbi:MAG TPA: PIG-L family deacetylase [Myxococcota bacterium]|nr:PIG-L family deacetylase [Myxococcota bacterium]
MNDWLDRVGSVLVLSAHADDCEYFCGGLMATLAARGASIVEVIATDNGRGSFELAPGELISRSREIEAAEAARIIGKKHVEFLGYPDGFLDDTPKNELRRIFIEWIRRVKPDLVLSFDVRDFDAHPDHRMVARAASEAAVFSHLPLFHAEQVEAGLAPHMTPYRLWFDAKDGSAGFVFDIGKVIPVKVQALLAHQSQMRLAMTEWKMMLGGCGGFPELAAIIDTDDQSKAIELLVTAWGSACAAGRDFEYGEAFRLEFADGIFRDFVEG